MGNTEKNTEAVYDVKTLGTARTLVLGIQHRHPPFDRRKARKKNGEQLEAPAKRHERGNDAGLRIGHADGICYLGEICTGDHGRNEIFHSRLNDIHHAAFAIGILFPYLPALFYLFCHDTFPFTGIIPQTK